MCNPQRVRIPTDSKQWPCRDNGATNSKSWRKDLHQTTDLLWRQTFSDRQELLGSFLRRNRVCISLKHRSESREPWDPGYRSSWEERQDTPAAAAAAAAKSLQSCPTLCDPTDSTAQQAPLSLGFSRQEYWSGLPFPSPMHESEKWKWSHSVMSDSKRPHGLQPTKLLRPWDSPGKSTGVRCHCLLWRYP